MSETVAERLNLIEIRDGKEEDKAFILATWLRGLRFGNDLFRLIEAKTYFKNYHYVIEKLLETHSVKVACLADDKDVILAYCVFKGDTLAWIFTKKAWRGIGIAKLIAPTTIRQVSHITEVGKSYLSKHTNIAFNPFSV